MKSVNNKYKSNISLLAICIFLILISFFSVSCTKQIKKFKGDYAIIYTNIFKPEGGIMDIDTNGRILGKEALEMQDILFAANSDDYIIMSGHRKNNNILYQSNGTKKEVHFLNNPKYTGVTAVELYNEKIVAIMNGNVSEGIYKTLLVIQDVNDKVLYEEIIKMYPHDLIIENQTLYISGNSKRIDAGDWDSKIMKFDLVKNEFIEEQTHDSLYNFKKLQLLNNDLYALAEDKNYNPRIISIIDKDTLDIKAQKTFEENIVDILSYDGYMFILFNDKLLKCDKDFNIIETKSINSDTGHYISYSLLVDKELYLFIRAEKKEVLAKGKIMIGKIARISLDNLSDVKYTDFKVDNSDNIENIVFFPTSFFIEKQRQN